MKPFAEVGLDLDQALEAIVIGGNALARAWGSRKRRRRVPVKQERLVRLVAKKGSVSLGQLVSTFEQDWSKVRLRREHKPRRVAEREFFRSRTDLAARVNAALVAGYSDESVRELMLDRTRSHLGLAFDHQAFSMWWLWADTVNDLVATLPGSSALGSRSTGLPTDQAWQPTGDDMQTPLRDETLVIDVVEDDVTGAWSFELSGHRVELERRHGFVKVDGIVHASETVKGLRDVGDLIGQPLDYVKRLVEAVESRTSLDNETESE